MSKIFYKSGYKYQLEDDYSVFLGFFPLKAISDSYITFSTIGVLKIKSGYAWDGPSGPTIDTKNFMRGSLVHDALYQLMREKYLDHVTYRESADRALQTICKEDGMSSIRAWYVYHSVRLFGDPSANPDNEKPVVEAP